MTFIITKRSTTSEEVLKLKRKLFSSQVVSFRGNENASAMRIMVNWVQNCKLFTAVIDCVSLEATIIAAVSRFYLSLIFAGKARILASEFIHMRGFTG